VPQTSHGLLRKVLRSRLVHELDLHGPSPSGAGLADPGTIEVLPQDRAETGDLPRSHVRLVCRPGPGVRRTDAVPPRACTVRPRVLNPLNATLMNTEIVHRSLTPAQSV
jgi:hypothetical protein